jgi:hypothetical protein
MPRLVLFNSLLPIVTVFLIGILVWHLKQIGWDVVRRDMRRGLVRRLRGSRAGATLGPS